MWLIWLVLSFALWIGEILTPTFVLACFAIGCLSAGIAAFFQFEVTIQLVVFIVSTLFVFAIIRPLWRYVLHDDSRELHTNTDALIGMTGLVSERIDAHNNSGRVIVRGEDWRGIADNHAIIEKGEEIKVLRVDGTKLIVTPIIPRRKDK